MPNADELDSCRLVHRDRAAEILDDLHSLHNPPYNWRIAAAQVHALLELASAIRSLRGGTNA
jgi:hypothetical protein